MINEKYVTEKLSIAQIADELACSKDAVRRTLKASGAEIREPRQHHGRPSQPKYGEQYRNGKLARHLGETRVKATIQEMRTTGLSLRQIARFLDHIGVPTKCRGKRWHPQMVQRVLGEHPAKTDASISIVEQDLVLTNSTNQKIKEA